MNTGKVYIVGAGPGRPDLISVAGFQALLTADVILVDRLVPEDFLERLGIPTSDKRTKRLHYHRSEGTQDLICQQLAHHALQGMTVVRLKGGDPFIFGRGADEFDYLASLGIEAEVIPGPSAATAVSTAAGFPLTRHARGRSFAVVTARVEGGGIHDAFPRSDSLVILMGVAVLDAVVKRLAQDNWPIDTPVAIVERGTLPWERRVCGPLGRICGVATQAGVASPALIVGEVAEGITADDVRPTVLFTGLDPSNFRGLGNLIHWPALHLVPHKSVGSSMPRIVEDLQCKRFGQLIFTDKTAVDAFFNALRHHQRDARILGDVEIVAIGQLVARQLLLRSIVADAAQFDSLSEPVIGRHVLLVAGTHIPSQMVDDLEAADASVTSIQMHQVVAHPELGRPLPPHDVIYFVSPSGVHAYENTYGEKAFEREVWCLGEATQRTVANFDVQAKIVAPTNVRSPVALQ